MGKWKTRKTKAQTTATTTTQEQGNAEQPQHHQAPSSPNGLEGRPSAISGARPATDQHSAFNLKVVGSIPPGSTAVCWLCLAPDLVGDLLFGGGGGEGVGGRQHTAKVPQQAGVSQAGAWTWLQLMGHGDMQGFNSSSLAGSVSAISPAASTSAKIAVAQIRKQGLQQLLQQQKQLQHQHQQQNQLQHQHHNTHHSHHHSHPPQPPQPPQPQPQPQPPTTTTATHHNHSHPPPPAPAPAPTP